MINVGVLSEVDTMTWRSPDAMLSTAQDYRPGCYGEQYHAWQATLDEDAVVFTTLPGNEPRPGTSWVDADKYWTGTGAMPRSAQEGSAAIHLYALAYAANGPGPLEDFTYLNYTHAYFPTERFDEVRQVGNWTLGRRGNGYVALWSWRPTSLACPRPCGDVHQRADQALRPGGSRWGEQRVDRRGRRFGQVGVVRLVRFCGGWFADLGDACYAKRISNFFTDCKCLLVVLYGI